jgi:predicted NAD/FAD-binding protein
MKIAVIGAGISGLTAALLLSKDHNVTLYEKEARLGGHAHTHIVGPNKSPVDSGFMVYNPERYPQFVSLLDYLEVESLDTSMTFSVNIENHVAFRANFPGGVFAEPKNIVSVRFWRFLYAILKFQKLAKSELENGMKDNETLKEFSERHSLNQDVTDWFLYPMLSAIWSMPETGKAEDFPAKSTFVFLNNHKLLDIFHPTWKTIAGGSHEYVLRLKKKLLLQKTKIITSAQIYSIDRTKDLVRVRTKGGITNYDCVVFATHADTALKLLAAPSKAEVTALKCFTYSRNVTFLHKDTCYLSRNKRLHAAWNYQKSSGSVPSFTYSMNILQHIPDNTPVLVTLNPPKPIPEKLVFAKMIYEHPQYSLKTIEGQARIRALQGTNRTFYAGAHLGYGFHEDGVNSAIDVANLLGINPPWLEN